MTAVESMMLAVSFGISMGFLVACVLINVIEIIHYIKRKFNNK